MKRCPNCGTENDDASKYCSKCGSVLVVASSTRLKGSMAQKNLQNEQKQEESAETSDNSTTHSGKGFYNSNLGSSLGQNSKGSNQQQPYMHGQKKTNNWIWPTIAGAAVLALVVVLATSQSAKNETATNVPTPTETSALYENKQDKAQSENNKPQSQSAVKDNAVSEKNSSEKTSTTQTQKPDNTVSTTPKAVVDYAGDVNIRVAPGVYSNRVRTASPGTKFSLTGNRSPAEGSKWWWYEIYLNGDSGDTAWICAEVISMYDGSDFDRYVDETPSKSEPSSSKPSASNNTGSSWGKVYLDNIWDVIQAGWDDRLYGLVDCNGDSIPELFTNVPEIGEDYFDGANWTVFTTDGNRFDYCHITSWDEKLASTCWYNPNEKTLMFHDGMTVTEWLSVFKIKDGQINELERYECKMNPDTWNCEYCTCNGQPTTLEEFDNRLQNYRSADGCKNFSAKWYTYNELIELLTNAS